MYMAPNSDHRPNKTLSLPRTKNGTRPADDAKRSADSKNGVQGEGNYDAARRFSKAEKEFVDSGRVPEAAGAASPKSEVERQEMIAAELAGKQRSKGEDSLPMTAKPELGTTEVPTKGTNSGE
jgi:hypothetical protein